MATTLSIAASNAAQLEGNSGSKAFAFTVNRTGDLSGASSALWRVVGVGNTPANAADFLNEVLPSGTVSFAAGESSKIISVDVSGDVIVENDEGFSVILYSSTGATIGTSSAIGTIFSDDLPSISLSLTQASVAEDGSNNLAYTFARTGSTAAPLTVNYIVRGTASSDDYASLPLGNIKSITFAAGASTTTLLVDPAADSLVETDETVEISLSPTIFYTISTPAAVVGTIINDDTNLAIIPTSINQQEGNSGKTFYTFTVIRTGLLTGSSTTQWSVTGIGGQPADANDFPGGVLPTGTVTLLAGETTKTITIEVNGDTIAENDETFAVTLANPTGATITTATASGTIVNDDTNLVIMPATVSQKEGNIGGTIFNFTVIRTGVVTGTSTANWIVAGNGDHPVTSDDFIGDAFPSGIVTFAVGETEQNIAIEIKDDSISEANEGFRMTLFNPSGTTIATASSSGVIIDDDLPIVNLSLNQSAVNEDGNDNLIYVFTRTGPALDALTVYYTISGSADSNDYSGIPAGSPISITFLAGESSVSLVVDPMADALAEADETVAITLSANGDYIRETTTAVIGTIVNDDTNLAISPAIISQAEGNSGVTRYTFTVTRTGLLSGSSSAQWSVAGIDGQPADANDFAGSVLPTGSITFAAGETSQTITIEVNGDSIAENDETFAVTLTDPIGATITTATASGTIVNDDTNLAILPATISQQEGNSGPTHYTFTVTRTGLLSGSSSAQWSVAGIGGQPADANDFPGGILPTGSVTFVAGETTKTITIEVNGDTIAENDETFAVTLANPTGATITTATASGTIVNDDTNLVIMPATVSQKEGNIGGTIFNFTVIRTGVVTGTSTANWIVAGNGDHPVTSDDFIGDAFPSGIVTFAAGETEQNIAIEIKGDSISEASEGFRITLFNPSGATINTASTNGVVIDDDLPIVNLSLNQSAVNEDGNGNLVYVFTRTGPALDALIVYYTISGSADSNDYSGIPAGSPKSITFLAGESSVSLVVDPTADALAEADETIAITLSANEDYIRETTTAVIGTIINDDTNLAISPGIISQAEGNGGVTLYTFTVTRTGLLSGSSTSQWSVTGIGQPADASDFPGGVLPTGSITFAAGESIKTITIEVNGDTIAENDETFAVTLTDPTGATITTATASGTIVNDDTNLAITPPTISQPEGNSGVTHYTFTVTRTGLLSGSSTAQWSVTGIDDQPADANDFPGGILPTGSVTFAAGETTKTIIIEVNGDSIAENDETFAVTLANPTGATITTATANGTIVNEDTNLEIAPAIISQQEGNSGKTFYTFTVIRTGLLTGSSTTQWSVTGIGGQPADANDFPGGVLPTGTVTFLAGETTKTITIEVNGDTIAENDETFAVILANPTGATITTATASCTIVNDDTNLAITPSNISQLEGRSGATLYTFTVNRTGVVSGSSTAQWSVAGIGDHPANADDFGGSFPTGTVTFVAGETSQTITIEVSGDSIAENDETFAISLSDPSGATITTANAEGIIVNDDANLAITPNTISQQEGDSGKVLYTFTVNRTGLISGSSTAQWSVAGIGDHPANADDFGGSLPTGTITFAAGETSKVITIEVNGDIIAENDEKFIVILSDPAGSSITTASAEGVIVNDDTNLGIVAINADQVEDNSGSKSFTFAIQRTGVLSGTSSTSWAAAGSGITPADASDFAAGILPSGTVTFASGETSKLISIDINGDTQIETDETFSVTLYDNSDLAPQNPTATGTIISDEPITISLALQPSITAEDGGQVFSYTFTRNGPTDAPLTINFLISGSADPTNDYTSDRDLSSFPFGSITFNPGDSIAMLEIRPTADTTIENDETIEIELLTSSEYAVGTVGPVVATIINNDQSQAALTISATDATKAEGNSGKTAYTFSVKRSGDTSGSSAAQWAVSSTQATGNDFIGGVLPSGTVSFGAGDTSKTITVEVNGDSSIEADESFIVTLTNPADATIATASASGTISNDDPTITLEVALASVTEDGTSNLIYTFTRTGPTTSALTVNYTVAGTATIGSDYSGIATTPTTKTVSFAAGSATATVTVDPTADTEIEADETVAFTLAAGTDYFIGTTNAVVGTINNDDFPAITLVVAPASVTEDGTSNLVYTFTRTGPTISALTVYYTVSGTASLGGDYSGIASTPTTKTVSFAAGSATATVTVDPIADTASEEDETVSLTIAAGTGYTIGTTTAVVGIITNDDFPAITLAVAPASVTEDGTSNLVYTFTRTGPTTSALTVNYTVAGTASLGGDYSGIATTPSTKTVSFAAGSVTATVTVSPTADTAYEEDETVSLTIAAGTGYTIGTTTAVVGTITNDDLPAITLAVSPSTVTEDGSSNLIYTFTRTGPTTSALTVNYTVAGTATIGSDYSGITKEGTTKTVTFAAGSASAIVAVDPVNDAELEPNETVALTLAAGVDYTVGTTTAVAGTIINNAPNLISYGTFEYPTFTTALTGLEAGSRALPGWTVVGGQIEVDNDNYVNLPAIEGRQYLDVTGKTGYSKGILSDPLSTTPGQLYKLTLQLGAYFYVGMNFGDAAVDVAINGAYAGTLINKNTLSAIGTDWERVSMLYQATSPTTSIQLLGSTAGGNLGIGIDDVRFVQFIPAPDDLPVITLAVSPTAVAEDSANNLIYTFSRTGPTTSTLTVNYTVGGTAILGSDYSGIATTPTSKTVSFAAGSATATVTVDPIADTAIEADETVALTLAAGTAYTIGTTTAVSGTISNDDFPAITLAVAPASVTEDGTSNLVYTFTRTGPTTSALTVNYTVSGTASLGDDYSGIATIPTTRAVSFAAGSATATVTVNPTADTEIEADETVALTLAAGTGYTIGTSAAVTGTISNDDPTITLTLAPAPVTEDGTSNLIYTFTRTGPITSALTVNYTVSGTATLGTDYTGIATTPSTKTVSFAAGSATATITVDPASDTEIEADETVAITLAAGTDYTIGTSSAVVGTITNDDFPAITLAVAPASVTEDGTSNLVYTFTRTGPTTSALTVNYTVSGTASLGGDYSGIATTPTTRTVSFAAGSATATVTVDPIADTAYEVDETISLSLASGIGYTIGTTSAVVGTITNDDPKVSITAIANGNEANASPTVFRFSRTGSTTAPLSVSYRLLGTAQAGSDYSGAITGTISFSAGSATAELSLPALADSVIDPGETIIAQIVPSTTATPSYFITAGQQTATATITAEGMVVTVNEQSRLGAIKGEVRNPYAFAALKSDGTVVSWGRPSYGGTTPAGLGGVTQVFSNLGAFAALKSDGTVVSWGDSSLGGTTPAGLGGVTQIFSTGYAFAALKSDGTVVCWGDTSYGGTTPTVLGGVTQIFSNDFVFAALKSDGTVVCWGDTSYGGTTPAGLGGVTQIFSNNLAFAALKSDGTVVSWGDTSYGGTTPAGLGGVTQIFSNNLAFSALKGDGAVVCWGDAGSGGTTPAGLGGVTQIFSNYSAFAALKSDGTVVCWGDISYGGTTPVGLSGVNQIFSTGYAFAALKSDGTVVCWGDTSYGGTTPEGLGGVTQIFSTREAFAALKSDGTVVCWGDANNGGTTPAGIENVTQIFSNYSAFAALKIDGTVVCWGDAKTPVGLSDVVGFANPFTDDRLLPTITLAVSPASASEDGNGNLIYTFTRTGALSNALTVNYTVAGSATLATDYTGVPPTGTTKSITFAAGAATATLTIDPIADASIEADETVSLTLSAGVGYIVGTMTAVVGTIINDDFPIISLAISPAAVAEDGTTNLVYTFSRTGSTTSALTVNYDITGTSDASDYTGAMSGVGKTITFGVGSTTATLTINPTADVTLEPDETVVLTLANGTGYTIGTTMAVSGTIIDDDFPAISLSVNPDTVLEDETSNLIYSFYRTGQTSAPLTVYYTVGGTASIDDYSAVPSIWEITFAAGQTSVDLVVNPTADNLAEADETVAITLLANSAYKVVTSTSILGTIINDETSLAISPKFTRKTEGSVGTTVFTYTVTRTGALGESSSASWSTIGVGGQPVNAADFVGGLLPSGTVSFAPGETRKNINILVSGDAVVEPNETFNVVLSNPRGATIGYGGAPAGNLPTTSSSNLIIGLGGNMGFGENTLSANDDRSTGAIDLISVFPFGLNFFGSTYNSIYLNNNGSITFDSPLSAYTPSPITQLTAYPIIAPFYADVDTRAGTLVASPGGTSKGSNLVYWDLDPVNRQATFTWDDVGKYSWGTSPNAFQLVLKDAGLGNLQIDFRYENINWLVGDASGGTLARAGYSLGDGYTYYEMPQSGTTQMGNLELTSNIGQPGLYRFTLPVVNLPSIARGAIVNDDTSVSISPSSLAYSEGASPTYAYTITRSGEVSLQSSVAWQVHGQWGIDRSDFLGSIMPSGTVVFEPGETTKTIQVKVQDDLAVESNETFVVRLHSAINTGIALNNATGTILNNDFPRRTGGDIHVVTYDGLAYPFQNSGIYTLTKSTSDDLHLALFLDWVDEDKSVSFATEVALKVENHSFHLKATWDDSFEIDYKGNTQILANSESIAIDDIKIRRIDKSLIFTNSKNEEIHVIDQGSYFDFSYSISPFRMGYMQGLMGNYDGNESNDTQPSWLSSAVQIPASPFAAFIGQNEYRPSFQLPPLTRRYEDIPQPVIDYVTSALLARGITDEILIIQTAYDVWVTGDYAYINDATDFNDSVNLVSPPPPPCFMSGTLIDTPSGEVPIESLRPGDLVLTPTGPEAIKFLGRTTRKASALKPQAKMPIRINKNSLGSQLPSRDTYCTPSHAFAVDDCLVEARALVNNESITNIEKWPDLVPIIYFSIELEDHQLVWANGLLTETYYSNWTSTGFSREAWDNYSTYLELYQESKPMNELPMSRIPFARQLPLRIRERFKLGSSSGASREELCLTL